MSPVENFNLIENLVVFRVNEQPVADYLNQNTTKEKLSKLRTASSFEAVTYESILNAQRCKLSFIKAEKTSSTEIDIWTRNLSYSDHITYVQFFW